MLNTRGQRLYRTTFSPGKSRLVPAPSSSEMPETLEEEIALAEHDNIAEGDASLIEVSETPEEAPLAEAAKRLEGEASLAESHDIAEDKASLTEMPAISEDANDLADVETNKTPSLVLDSQDDDDLADEETQKMPALSLDSGEAGDLADVETHKTPALTLDFEDISDVVDLETSKMPSFTPPVSPVSHPESQSEGEAHPVQVASARHTAISKRRKALLLVLMGMLLIPSFIIVFEVVNALILYRQMQDGLTHLQNIQALFRGGPAGDLTRYFDTHKLRQAQIEMNAAHADFVSLSNKLDHDDAFSLAANLMPSRISTFRALGHIAVIGTAAAQQTIQTAIEVAPAVALAFQQGIAHADTQPVKPYITPYIFQKIASMFDAITPLIHDMNGYARSLALDTLPISEKQHQMLASLVLLLPILETDLSQARAFRSEFRWLLGIDEQRTFLVEPMDRAELRATGGFTGQFGDLIFNGAHMGPLKLANIGKYEEDHTIEGSPPDKTVYAKVIGQTAPANYLNWWPVANFGLRDANLSADFPTSARIAMDRYEYEFNKKVDGVIMFTPTLIKQILHVTGPLIIPVYNEHISEYNLEDRLHYYQLDNKGIRREEIVEHVEDTQIARKLFTQKVTAALFSKVTHLSFNKLLPMANEMLQSMKSKDLQIFVTNPQLESLIGVYGSTASLDRSISHDGLFIVQSNLSASKASQYVTTSVQDTITLDRKGGATHNLQIVLDYQQKGDVYGFDTYRDYLRVYVPMNSQLLAGNGFEQYARPYCGDAQSRYRLCLPNVYGDGSLVCSGFVKVGYATAYLRDPYAGRDHPLDEIGPPQNQQSDEAGRGMFGGWVVIPKNCIMKVTLSWYVPSMGQSPYSLLLQAQAGVFSQLNLTVHPAPGTCASSPRDTQYFSGRMDGKDTTFMVQASRSRCALTTQ